MAKDQRGPAVTRPVPTAEQIRNKDPIRVAWADFISDHLFKVLVVIIIAAVLWSGALQVETFEVDFQITKEIGFTLTLGSNW